MSELTDTQFKSLARNEINKITTEQRMTGVDTADRYTIYHYGKRKVEVKHSLINDVDRFFNFNYHFDLDLLSLTREGQKRLEAIEEVEKQAKKHSAELRKLRELQEKYGHLLSSEEEASK